MPERVVATDRPSGIVVARLASGAWAGRHPAAWRTWSPQSNLCVKATTSMNATHHSIRIDAPPSHVYAALLDPQLIPRWRVPTGMRCRVHEFDAREGGVFRVSLTYETPDPTGKSSDHTDTYHGWFEQLVPHERVVERLEFETADPRMQGEMRVITHLAPEGGGTRLTASHENLPPGVEPADNEAGWQESLEKLAALLRRTP